jgi:NTE family protein
MDLEPDIIVGTSMGAVIGSTMANRTNLDGMVKVLNRLDVNKILKISRESRRELEKAIGKSLVREIGVRRKLKGESSKPPVKLARLFTFFKLLTRNSSIEELPVDYAAVATNLENGREVVIREGKVYRAAAASAAIPGFIPPVKLDGKKLIDGGVVDTLPVLPALEMGATAVIAVNVNKSLSRYSEETPLSLFYRTTQMRKQELVRTKLSIARRALEGELLVLNPAVDDVNWLDFNAVDSAASLGEEAAKENSQSIERLFRAD